jgi:hypothetical protein
MNALKLYMILPLETVPSRCELGNTPKQRARIPSERVEWGNPVQRHGAEQRRQEDGEGDEETAW